jgi:O-antigen/teichoic acid export membrane protein
MDIEHQTAIALKWNGILKLAGQLFSWSVTLITLRLLLPEDYGVMAIAAVIVSVIAGMAEFGLGTSLIQTSQLDRSELSRLAGMLAALNLACGAAVVLASGPLAEIFDEPKLRAVIQVASLQFVLYAIEAVPQSLIQREMNFRIGASIDLCAAVVSSATTLCLAWLGFGVWALVLGNLAGGCLRTVLLVTFGTFVRPTLGFQGLARHLRFGGLVTATRLLWQVTYQVDTLIAARFMTHDLLGMYSVSMHLATLPMNKTMGIINQVAFPAVARLQDELERLRERLLSSFRLLSFAAIAALWGLSSVAREFVDVVLGPQWAAAVFTLQVVSFVAPLRMLMALLATAVAAIGRAELELRNTVVSAVVLPVAFLIGVQWGINGLAVSWLVATPIILAINLKRTCAPLGLTFGSMLGVMRAPLIAGVAMYGAVVAARFGLSDLSEGIRLFVLSSIGGLVYLTFVQFVDRGIWIDARRVLSAVRS